MRKVQTSINLSQQIKNIVDTEGLNLSKFVEEQLEKYFSVSSVEAVDEKISENKQSINALEQKRADLVSQGMAETHDEAVEKEVWKCVLLISQFQWMIRTKYIQMVTAKSTYLHLMDST